MIMRHYVTKISGNTFENKHIRYIIDRHLAQHNSDTFPFACRILDPFARESFTTKLEYAITNDLNPEMPTDYHLEANDFCELILSEHGAGQYDIILWDPPYTMRQLKELYDGIGLKLFQEQTQNMWGRAIKACQKLLKVNGHFISFGYHTKGIRSRNFSTDEIHIFQTNFAPDAYDVLCTVQRKVQHNLFQYGGYEEE